MHTETPTMAGLMATAGAARLGTVAPGACLTGSARTAGYGIAQHQVVDHHPSSTWTPGTAAKHETFMVLTGKNRPTRPLSELSP